MDAQGAIMSVPFALPITRRRYAAGAHSGGTYTPGASTDSTIQASVQPARYGSLLRLPEGMRTRGAVDIWSESELRAGDETDGTLPDEITWQGKQWQVEMVDPYLDEHHAPDLEHWKAVAVRKNS